MSSTSTAGPVVTNMVGAFNATSGKAQQSNTQSAGAFAASLLAGLALFGIQFAAFLILKGFFPRI